MKGATAIADLFAGIQTETLCFCPRKALLTFPLTACSKLITSYDTNASSGGGDDDVLVTETKVTFSLREILRIRIKMVLKTHLLKRVPRHRGA